MCQSNRLFHVERQVLVLLLGVYSKDIVLHIACENKFGGFK